MAENIDRSQFKFSTEIRVRLNETDAVGIVFHGNYFTYMDVGRVDYLRNLDLMERGRPIKGFDNMVVHSACDFRNPAHYDDAIIINVRLARLGRCSFRFEFLFFNKRNNQLLAKGESVHCAVNLEDRSAVPLPDFFREAIQSYEASDLENAQ